MRFRDFFVFLHRVTKNVMNEVYYYGLAAMIYITTCWTFVTVRWFHTCQEPKERRSYIWPDRKLQCPHREYPDDDLLLSGHVAGALLDTRIKRCQLLQPRRLPRQICQHRALLPDYPYSAALAGLYP